MPRVERPGPGRPWSVHLDRVDAERHGLAVRTGDHGDAAVLRVGTWRDLRLWRLRGAADRLDGRSSRADVHDGGVDHAESKTTDTVIASERARKKLSRYGWAPADRPRRPVLFVNPNSGGGKAARAGVAERARERGIEVIVLSPGQNLAALVGEVVARGADALGVAGGDGSLAVVVGLLRCTSFPSCAFPPAHATTLRSTWE
jgi:Diacylglycerol kinase catalytic domain